MIDLKDFTARGFPGKWDQAIANTPVAGIDRHQSQSEVLLCPETEPILYGGEYSPTRLRYSRGARPKLERIARALAGQTPFQRAISAMEWVTSHVIHPHLTGPLEPDRAFTEEQLIQSGRGWCNEQARVFIALCEVMCLPGRLCFLYHKNTRCGHAAAEVYVNGRWAFFDVTFNVLVPLPDGRPAEGRELSGAYRRLAHQAYRPALTEYYRRILPFVDDLAGWGRKDRPRIDQGGNLLNVLGICDYVIDGAARVDV